MQGIEDGPEKQALRLRLGDRSVESGIGLLIAGRDLRGRPGFAFAKGLQALDLGVGKRGMRPVAPDAGSMGT